MPSDGKLLPLAILALLAAAAVLAASAPRVELILHWDGSVSLRGGYEGPMPDLPSDIAAFGGTLSLNVSAEPNAVRCSTLFDGILLPRVWLFEDFALELAASVTPAADRVLRSFAQNLSLSYGSANNLSASISCSSVAHVRGLVEETSCSAALRAFGPNAAQIGQALLPLVSDRAALEAVLRQLNITWVFVRSVRVAEAYVSPLSAYLSVSVELVSNLSRVYEAYGYAYPRVHVDPRVELERTRPGSLKASISWSRGRTHVSLELVVEENINAIIGRARNYSSLTAPAYAPTGPALPLLPLGDLVGLVGNLTGRFAETFEVRPSVASLTVRIFNRTVSARFETFRVAKRGASNPGETLLALHDLALAALSDLRRSPLVGLAEKLNETAAGLVFSVVPEREGIRVTRGGRPVAELRFHEIPEVVVEVVTPSPTPIQQPPPPAPAPAEVAEGFPQWTTYAAVAVLVVAAAVAAVMLAVRRR